MAALGCYFAFIFASFLVHYQQNFTIRERVGYMEEDKFADWYVFMTLKKKKKEKKIGL